jgi:threonine dehydratase
MPWPDPLHLNLLMLKTPTFEDILLASERIASEIHHTPVLTSSNLNALTGVNLFFKCENFQKVGAFKYRGAANAVLSLTREEASKGVATHSSGNHAAALALAAKKRGIPCFVVMPRTAPGPKIEAVKHYGASVTFCEPNLQSRESTLEQIVSETNATVIHPYDNFQVIAGQGTAAKELLEQAPGLDVVLAPVGGGGLLSGTALAVKAMKPRAKVYGCEPALADDASRSFRSGQLMPALPPNTVADGLLTSLSERTFTIIRMHVDDIFTVSEESILQAMLLVWQRMKIVIEPSAAVPLAALINNREKFTGKNAGIILSGGNVDLLNLPFRQG